MSTQYPVYKTRLGILCAILIVVPFASRASSLSGQVVSVADGDTITVLDFTREQYKIRLSGIDAPEKKQPYGQRSKQSLSDLVFNQRVTVE